MRTRLNCPRIDSEGGGSCDGSCEPFAFRFHMEKLQQLAYVSNALRQDYRTSRMGDFMLPSQPSAKCQQGIGNFTTHLSGMTTTIRRCIASQHMRWRQKITGQVFIPTLWNLRTTGPCRLRELQCTVCEYKLTFNNWHTSSGAES